MIPEIGVKTKYLLILWIQNTGNYSRRMLASSDHETATVICFPSGIRHLSIPVLFLSHRSKRRDRIPQKSKLHITVSLVWKLLQRQCKILVFIYILLADVGMELRASSMLRKCYQQRYSPIPQMSRWR